MGGPINNDCQSNLARGTRREHGRGADVSGTPLRIGRGELPRDVLVWRAGMSEWATAASLRGTDLPPDFAAARAERVISRLPQVQSTASILTEPPITEEPKALELFVVPQPKPTGSFFARHWRGELSLGVSYWVCGLVFTFLFEVFDRAYWPLIDATSTPKLWASSIWGVVLASVALASGNSSVSCARRAGRCESTTPNENRPGGP